MNLLQPVVCLALLFGLLVGSSAHAEDLLAQAPTNGTAALCEPEDISLSDGGNSCFALASEHPMADRSGGASQDKLGAEPPALIPRAEAGPSLSAGYPVIFNEWVQHFLDFFQAPKRREITSIWLNRSGRYLDMIQAIFKNHGLPAELAYVAMIESGFNPVAVSRAGAKGLWQFMEDTARRYGLRVDRWVDERLDPEKSTVAAAMYLRDLFGQFGSWLLAKAAYNAGELKVSQALQRSQTNDFWTLTRGRVLREETKRFVPAILAATLIGLNPEQYGFEVSRESPLVYDLVMVRPLADLKRLAVSAGLSPEDLTRLNPELRRGVTPPGALYPLKVPAGDGAAVLRVAEQPRALPVKATVHVVRPRETLGAIARRHGVSIADLVRWNRLADSSRIFPGDRLVVSGPR